MERLIQRAQLAPQLGAPKRRRLDNKVPPPDQLRGITGPHIRAQPITPPPGVNGQGIAIDQLRLRVRGKVLHHRAHRPRHIQIVTVEPAEDLPPRRRKPLVDGVGLPPVRRRHPGKTIWRGLQESLRAVGGATIHDDVFDMWIILAVDAVEHLRKILTLVIRRSNNRN